MITDCSVINTKKNAIVWSCTKFPVKSFINILRTVDVCLHLVMCRGQQFCKYCWWVHYLLLFCGHDDSRFGLCLQRIFCKSPHSDYFQTCFDTYETPRSSSFRPSNYKKIYSRPTYSFLNTVFSPTFIIQTRLRLTGALCDVILNTESRIQLYFLPHLRNQHLVIEGNRVVYKAM